jgi:hypothetical protein
MESILVERSIAILSLAVSLVDDYIDRQPIGEIKLTMGEKEAIKNPSGYYLFLDLPPGNYRLRVQPQYHFDQEVDVSLPLSGEPVVSLTLKPNPCYPFPESATLIRGMVKDTDDKPVAEATAGIIGKEIENKTTQNGEFVLYFKTLTEQDIIKVNNKRYVKGDGDKELQLQVTHPSYESKTVSIEELEEGKTASVSITLQK